MRFDDLDATTREYMEREFVGEQQSEPRYRPKTLSPAGLAAFPGLMLQAIRAGTDETLEASLLPEHMSADILPKDLAWRGHQLALSEFNTFYVRGLAKRLLDEGVEECEVYLGGSGRTRCRGVPNIPHEGGIVKVRDVYEGHRRRYWPEEDRGAFSVPDQGGCHHTIRRIR